MLQQVLTALATGGFEGRSLVLRDERRGSLFQIIIILENMLKKKHFKTCCFSSLGFRAEVRVTGAVGRRSCVANATRLLA